jgi:hypothetical protein
MLSMDFFITLQKWKYSFQCPKSKLTTHCLDHLMLGWWEYRSSNPVYHIEDCQILHDANQVNGLERKPRTFVWQSNGRQSFFSIIKSNNILQLKESRCCRLKQIMTTVFYVLVSKLQVTFLQIGNANFPADPLLCGMANFTLQMVWKPCLLMLPIFYSSL